MENYYDNHAKEFFDGTVNADMSENYSDFLSLVKTGRILDAGCGSGRDSLAFSQKGYEVVAIDASLELCKLASEYLGFEVLNMKFQDMDFKEEFDGIWAASSLLHVPTNELPDVLIKFRDSLKEGGVMHASFKYGDFEGERNGRYFVDLDEVSSRELFEEAGFEVLKIWTTNDVRKGREHELWLNILVQK